MRLQSDLERRTEHVVRVLAMITRRDRTPWRIPCLSHPPPTWLLAELNAMSISADERWRVREYSESGRYFLEVYYAP